MKTNIVKLTMAITAAATLTACSNTEVFSEENIENNLKTTYADNFKKQYPNVNLNQNWDYSTKQEAFSLPTANKARTRAGEGTWNKESDWYYVESNTLDWMHEQLVEGEDHTDLGKPFYMSVPGNDFYIVPIYQGVASAVWEFHVVIGDEDYLIWGKSEDIQITDVRNSDWHSVVQGTYERSDTEPAYWESLFNTDGNDKFAHPDGTRNTVTGIRAIPRKFSGFPVGEDMYFYLKVTKGDVDRANEGAQQSTLNHQILALNCPLPTNLPENYESMIIGCEDANLSLSDWDYNDVVFLVYGTNVPKPVVIEEGDAVVSKKIVRYLVEDLGSIDDFDFNDIVIDVADVTEKTPTYTNGVLTSWTTKAQYQEATIRHLGGTLPFTLKIGNTEYAAGGQETFQTSPNTTFRVEGWNINQHNVTVNVQQQSSTGTYTNTVKFPKAGEVPMIIAVDPTQAWMPERQSVPESWFTVAE